MPVKKIALWVGSGLVAIMAIALSILFLFFPRGSAAPDIKVAATPELIARGDYLFNHQYACTGCHTPEIEPHRFSRVFDSARIGAGRAMGGPPDFPAEINAPNITPTALADWTDGEIYRAIVSGVSKDGRAMFPVMPYVFYNQLDPEDVKAMIAYLRSLPPQPVTLDPIRLPMPLPLVMRLIPSDPRPTPRPDGSDELALGKYLAFASSCFECHTKRNDKGEPVGIPFAGGNPFSLPGGGKAISANLTPDKDTGIGKWSRADFIARFRTRSPERAALIQPGPQDYDSEMPWTAYAGMSDADLGAIFAYLQSLPPTTAEVRNFNPPATAEEAPR